MKSKLLSATVLFLTGLWIGQSLAGEIVLQNGINGYQGCTDTHIDFKPAFTTFTQSDTLKIEHFYTAC